MTTIAASKPTWRTRCRPLWARLHSLAYAGTLTEAIVLEVVKQIPCSRCRRHSRKRLAAKPFPDAPADHSDYIREWHDEINVSRGGRAWTKEESEERWHAAPFDGIKPASTPV